MFRGIFIALVIIFFSRGKCNDFVYKVPSKFEVHIKKFEAGARARGKNITINNLIIKYDAPGCAGKTIYNLKTWPFTNLAIVIIAGNLIPVEWQEATLRQSCSPTILRSIHPAFIIWAIPATKIILPVCFTPSVFPGSIFAYTKM